MRRSAARRIGTAIATFALLGGLAACGQDGQDVGFGGQPPGPETPVPDPGAPEGPVPPPGGRAVVESQVDPSALPQDYPRLVWTVGDGSTVGVYGQEGGCSTVRAELVEQTDELVRIRMVESSDSDGPCTMDLRFPDLSVSLDEPQDERTVVLEAENLGVVPDRGGPTG